jgi:ubiquinone/menaquinone biosynthesis C-methylase UbiE
MKNDYWDIKANDYDNHMKKSKNAYDKVIELVKKEVNKSQILLDIGTGTGAIPIAIANYLDKIIATDYSQTMIDVANNKIKELNINNITFQVQDGYNLIFNDEMFDVVLAANILHLLDKPEHFLNSIKRLLKESGKLIIPTFMHNENIKTKIISRILKYKGHPIVTRFDSKSFVDFVENCGYKVEKQILLPNIMPMLFLVASKK